MGLGFYKIIIVKKKEFWFFIGELNNYRNFILNFFYEVCFFKKNYLLFFIKIIFILIGKLKMVCILIFMY